MERFFSCVVAEIAQVLCGRGIEASMEEGQLKVSRDSIVIYFEGSETESYEGFRKMLAEDFQARVVPELKDDDFHWYGLYKICQCAS